MRVFVTPDEDSPDFATPKLITGISVGGRFELKISPENPFGEFLGDEDASRTTFKSPHRTSVAAGAT